MPTSNIFSPEAEEKAWNLLRRLMHNDEQFFSFQTLKKPIEIKGSAGGIYSLYPNGEILSDKKGKGRIYQKIPKFPVADILATAYVWITANEIKLRSQWGCGNIAIDTLNEVMLSANMEINAFGFKDIYCFDLCPSTKIELKENDFTRCSLCGCIYFYMPETQNILYNFRNLSRNDSQEITSIEVLKHYLKVLKDEDDPIVNLILKYKKEV